MGTWGCRPLPWLQPTHLHRSTPVYAYSLYNGAADHPKPAMLVLEAGKLVAAAMNLPQNNEAALCYQCLVVVCAAWGTLTRTTHNEHFVLAAILDRGGCVDHRRAAWDLEEQHSSGTGAVACMLLNILTSVWSPGMLCKGSTELQNPSLLEPSLCTGFKRSSPKKRKRGKISIQHVVV